MSSAAHSRRHHLSPVKPMRSMRSLGSAFLDMNSLSPTGAKRPLNQSDENNDPFPAFIGSPSKRAKSSTPPSKTSSKLKPKPKRAFGTALADATNTRVNSARAPRCANKPVLFDKLSRAILKPTRVAKKTPSSTKQSSPRGSGRTIKHSYSPPAFRRVDPPSSLRAALGISSIDSLLAAAGRPRSRFSPAATPAEPTPAIPDSWVFDIYEDTPEETLQNLMEHSTHTLYISDDSDNESNASELQELGKENISPTRLAEIMAIEPSERANIMRVDPPEKALPRRHRGREPLREMQKEELTPPTAALDSAPETFKTPKLGDETYAAFFTTPKKNSKKVLDEDEQQEELASTPKSPSTPGWVVFESDHEGDDSDGGGLDSEEDAAKVPLPLNDDPFELGEDPRFVDFSDSVGSVSEEEDEDY